MKEVRRKFSRLPWHNQGSEHEPIISGAGDGRGWVHSPSPSRGSAWTPTSLVPAPKGDPGPLRFTDEDRESTFTFQRPCFRPVTDSHRTGLKIKEAVSVQRILTHQTPRCFARLDLTQRSQESLLQGTLVVFCHSKLSQKHFFT